MRVEFSSTGHSQAKEYLAHKDYDFLNAVQKDYILKNLGDIRVQDPMMYSPARVAVHENGAMHSDEIGKLATP